jgi:hypothetical protein
MNNAHNLEADNAGVVEAFQKHNQKMSSNWKPFEGIHNLTMGFTGFETRKIGRERAIQQLTI